MEFHNIRDSEHAGIVIIHQELALIPELSIAENIFLGNEVASGGVIDWMTTRSAGSELLARVGLSEDPDTPIKDIGVGKQQLVEIAKALSKDVKLLILDEPTAALNEGDSQHLLDLLRGCAPRASPDHDQHKLNEIEQIADEITIIRDGKSIETLDVKADGVDEDRIIRGMVGRDLESRFPDHTPEIGEIFFEVKDWTVRHPNVADRLVCKSASFYVRRGEIVGFAGLMGAGPHRADAHLFGRSYGIFVSAADHQGRQGDPAQVGARGDRRTGSPTSPRTARPRPQPPRRHQAHHRLGQAEGSPSGLVVDEREEYKYAEEYRKALRTKAPTVDEGVSKLSGGNQQKVVLAKWMFTEPDLLILDEPTRGIDVGAKYEIYGIIQRLAAEGKGVIVISSELPELIGLSTGSTPSSKADHGVSSTRTRRPGDADATHDLDYEAATPDPMASRPA